MAVDARVDLGAVRPGDAAEGQGIVLESGLWVPGNVVREITSDDDSVTITDLGGGVFDLATVSTGGGTGPVLLLDYGDSVPGGTPADTVVFEKAAAPTVYDFTAGALPAGWSKHGSPTETFDGTGMTSTFTAGQGYHCTALPTGSEFTVEMEIISLTSQATMFGPNITDGSGTGAQVNWYNAPAGVLNINISSYSYASVFTNNLGTFSAPNRIRIHKVGSLYYGSYSFDGGVTWSAESLTVTSGITPARIGIGSAFGSSSIKVSKVIVRTSSSGKAKGYWDGSALQPLN